MYMKPQTAISWAHLAAALAFMLLISMLTGCGAGGFGCGAGFVVNNSALEVTDVSDSQTRTAICRVILSNIRFNGATITDLQSLVPAQLSHGVMVEGDTLVCD